MEQRKTTGSITNEDIYLFHQGTHYKAYHMFGSHIMVQNGQKGVRFSVWAPHAGWVSVVGDFNEWNIHANKMKKISSEGIWEVFIPGLGENQIYKYAIGSCWGEVLYKYDPFSFYSELPPRSASVIYDLEGYVWKDEAWIQRKMKISPYHQPMNIYEVHLGSWKRKNDGSFLTYRDLAYELVDYVAEMGYTHIEIMPVMEYPFDGSWGYQSVGYYAVTSRYGTPKDFMFFIDRCHQNGIGVILDWVPSHFPKDAHGLARFDGTAIYEYADPRKGEQPQWGTLVFDFGRTEVQSFLISNAIFWLEYFHIDGLRVDAVSSMLYLNYSREDWVPNCYGGSDNLEAIAFIKKLNETVFAMFPNTIMVAEESSEWPMVTFPTFCGGLGFNFKWNMGWMNDTLKYCSMDPLFRKGSHNLITFSMMYAFSENFILPLSHDEVVHGKRSLLDKMPGDYAQKFAELRNLYAYMIGHPGKKLLFMGGEFGQFIEWKYYDSLDWHLLGYEKHKKMLLYVKELNQMYLRHPCLWEEDYSWKGFQWIEPNDCDQSVLSFIRYSKNHKEWMVIVVNFTPVTRYQYRIGVPAEKYYHLVFNTDEEMFGGLGNRIPDLVKVEDIPYHNFSQSISITLPASSTVFYKPKQNDDA